MKRLLLLTLLHLIIFIGSSAQPTCSVRTFGIRDGLPTGYVTSIKQSSDGLIWIATWNGLCCYDGNQFSVFQGEPWGSDDALSTYRISAIEPDSQGNVWVRTYDSGLYLYDTHQCRFINVGLLVERQYGKPIKPRNFYAMPSGYMWITDEHGAMNLRIDDRYPTDTAHITVVDMAAYPQLGSRLHKVETDRQGNEWLVGDDGMLRLDGKEWRKGVFTHHPQEQTTDSRGRQWPADKNVLWVEDRFGTLWQLTRDGKLSYYDEQRQQLQFHQQLPAIDKWTIDQQHNVWFSSNRGLSLLNFQYQYLRQLPVQHDEQTRSLLSRRDGTVWAGTYDGYIAVYTADRMLSGWITPQGRLSVAPVKFADRIYTMLEDSHGHVWIGTKGQGLYRLAANGSAVSHFMPDKGDAYSISHPDIYDLDEDEQGNLWIATFGGGVNV